MDVHQNLDFFPDRFGRRFFQSFGRSSAQRAGQVRRMPEVVEGEVDQKDGISEDVYYDHGCSNTRESRPQKQTGKVT